MASSDCKQAPRGKPKSGRVWKSVKEKSFGNLHRQKQLKTSWSKKMAIKRERQLVKAFEQELKDAKATEEEERKKRRKENIKRKEENARKSEIVQKIKNPAKLKKMKKKHLRMVRKTKPPYRTPSRPRSARRLCE